MLKNTPTLHDFSEGQLNAFAESIEIEMIQLQRKLIDMNIPVLIAIDGWSTAGKGHCINQIVAPLDPRGYAIQVATDTKEVISPLQDFWCASPAQGTISIFDRSWYRPAMRNKTYGDKKKKFLLDDALNFELQQLDNGCLVIKIFLHVSRKEQARRIKLLQSDPHNQWRVNANDLKQNLYYKEYRKAASKIINASDTTQAPWHIVAADNRFHAQKQCLEIIKNAFTQATENTVDEKIKIELPLPSETSVRSKTDINSSISKETYNKCLPKLQRTIQALSHQLYKEQRSVLMIFEGWDAAGKGGSIRRLTRMIDPRDYVVHPVAAPTSLELKHHYLWRFWNRLPKPGAIAIHDRSWYGRVLVERIEGYCSENDWKRAYQEIVDNEKHLINNGTIIIKFWLDIDSSTQQKRFDLRLQTPHKTWKITEEDWRNRNKWQEYEQAVDDMIHYTSHEKSSWQVIPANQKRFARIAILEHTIDCFQKALEA